MTKEEILAMPAGPELDALVAERVMGCQPKKSWNGYDCGCGNAFRRPHSDELLHEDKCHSHSGLNCDGAALAGYSTDIAAAWEVVEKFRIAVAKLKHWNYETRVYREAWWAKPLAPTANGVDGGQGHTDSEIWFEEGDEASGETAPLAICRAALLSTLED
jgi:hypothetical protein